MAFDPDRWLKDAEARRAAAATPSAAAAGTSPFDPEAWLARRRGTPAAAPAPALDTRTAADLLTVGPTSRVPTMTAPELAPGQGGGVPEPGLDVISPTPLSDAERGDLEATPTQLQSVYPLLDAFGAFGYRTSGGLYGAALQLADLLHQPGNLLARALGRPDWQTRIEDLKADPDSIRGGFYRFLEASARSGLDAGTQISPTARANTSIETAVRKGQWATAGRQLFYGVMENAGQFVIQYLFAQATGGATAGLAAMGTLASGQQYVEVMDNEDMSPLQRTLNPLLTGAAEAAFERVGTGSTIEKILGSKAGRWGLLRAIREVLIAGAVEGAEEADTKIFNNITDRFTNKRNANGELPGPFDGVPDAAVISAFSGMGYMAPTATQNALADLRRRTPGPLDIDPDTGQPGIDIGLAPEPAAPAPPVAPPPVPGAESATETRANAPPPAPAAALAPEPTPEQKRAAEAAVTALRAKFAGPPIPGPDGQYEFVDAYPDGRIDLRGPDGKVVSVSADTLAQWQNQADAEKQQAVATLPVKFDDQGPAWTALTPVEHREVNGVWRLVDARELLASSDPGYEKVLQPRNRLTQASREQITAIANAPRAELLAESATTDDGAPIVDNRGLVLSGNGRIMGLRQAYANGTAAAYRIAVLDKAKALGLDPAAAANMQAPVLVRQATTLGEGLTPGQFTMLSNRPKVLGFTEAEQAANDAKMIVDQGLLGAFATDESGNVLAASNREFLRGFVRHTDPTLLRSDGTYGDSLKPRVQRAMLAVLLGEHPEAPRLIQAAIEQGEELGLRRQLAGLMNVAGGLSQIGQRKPDYNIRAELGRAVADLLEAKRQHAAKQIASINDFMANPDMLKAQRTPLEDVLLEFLWNATSAKQITDALNRYIELASKVDTDPGAKLFNLETPNATKLELIRKALGRETSAPGRGEGAAVQSQERTAATGVPPAGGSPAQAPGVGPGQSGDARTGRSAQDTVAPAAAPPPAATSTTIRTGDPIPKARLVDGVQNADDAQALLDRLPEGSQVVAADGNVFQRAADGTWQHAPYVDRPGNSTTLVGEGPRGGVGLQGGEVLRVGWPPDPPPPPPAPAAESATPADLVAKPPVPILDAGEAGPDTPRDAWKQLRGLAGAAFANRDSGMRINITGNALRHSIFRGYTRTTGAIHRVLPQLIESAVYAETYPPRLAQDRHSLRSMHTFYGAARVEGMAYRVRLKAKEFLDPARGIGHYDLTAVEIERAGELTGAGVTAGQPPGSTAQNVTIRDLLRDVKREDGSLLIEDDEGGKQSRAWVQSAGLQLPGEGPRRDKQKILHEDALSSPTAQPPQFDVADSAPLTQGTTARSQRVARILARQFPGLFQSGAIRVVDDWQDLPRNILTVLAARFGKKSYRRVRGVTAWSGNGAVMYVVAGNARSVGEALRKAQHEIIGHYGVRTALGADAYNQLLEEIKASGLDQELAEFGNAYGLDPTEDAAEVLARAAEVLPADSPLWQRVAATVRRFLRRLGIRLPFTDTDLRAILRAGRRAAENAAPPSPADTAAPAFAMDPTGPGAPWPSGFPNVKPMTTQTRLRAHPDYDAAKAGDVAAAQRVVADLAPAAKLRVLGARHAGAIVVPVHAVEATGTNQIPRQLAERLGVAARLEVDTEIVQASRVGRTGSGGWYRLAVRPEFDGQVQAGRDYILVDDTVTQGGTLSELRQYIEARGGHVVDMVTMGAARFSAKIALSEPTRLALERKYGVQYLHEFLARHNLYGGSHGAFTEAEARLILSARSLDAAGDRIAAARREASLGAGPEVLREPRPAEPNQGLTPPADAGVSEGQGVYFSGPLTAEAIARVTPGKRSEAQHVADGRHKANPDQLTFNFTHWPAVAAAGVPAGTGAMPGTAAAASGVPDQPGKVTRSRLRDRLTRIGAIHVAHLRITSPREAAEVLWEIRNGGQEKLVLLPLSEQRHVLPCGPIVLSIGLLDRAQFHTREVLRALKLTGAKHFVIAHNHPSGDPTPSAQDLGMTRNLEDALVKVGMPSAFLDHIIINGDQFFSYKTTTLEPYRRTPTITTRPLSILGELGAESSEYDAGWAALGTDPVVGQRLDSPDDAMRVLRAIIGSANHDVVALIGVGTKHVPVAMHLVARTDIEDPIQAPNAMRALLSEQGVQSVVVGWIVPTVQGQAAQGLAAPTPTARDIAMTRRLVEIGKSVGTEVLDVVVGDQSIGRLSFREQALLEESPSYQVSRLGAEAADALREASPSATPELNTLPQRIARVRAFAGNILDTLKQQPLKFDSPGWMFVQNNARAVAARVLKASTQPGFNPESALVEMRAALAQAAPPNATPPAAAAPAAQGELLPQQPAQGMLFDVDTAAEQDQYVAAVAGQYAANPPIQPPAPPPAAATPSPLAVRIANSAAGTWLRNMLSWGEHVGGRDPNLNELESMRKGTMEGARHEVARLARRLRIALKRLDRRLGAATPLARANLEQVLKGERDPDRADIGDSPEAAAALAEVLRARAEIDRLSEALLPTLGDIETPNRLQIAIENNLGRYVIRPYLKFIDPRYRPSRAVYAAAREFIAGEILERLGHHEELLGKVLARYKTPAFRQRLYRYMQTGDETLIAGESATFQRRAHRLRTVYAAIAAGMNNLTHVEFDPAQPAFRMWIDPDKIAGLAKGTVNELLEKDTHFENVFGGAASPQWRQIRKSFIRRKQIPEQIRELFGEVHDIAALYQMTAMRQRQVLVAHRFQTLLLEHSESLPVGHPSRRFYQHAYEDQDGRKFDKELKGPAYGPLEGWRTDKPTFDLLANVERVPFDTWWMKGYMSLLVMPRYAKTVLNPPGWIRNFASNWFNAMADGEMLHPVSYARGWQRAIETLTRNPDEYERLMAMGLVTASAHGAELKATVTEAFGSPSMVTPEALLDRIRQSLIERPANRLAEWYALGDNIHKMVAYYAKTARGVSEADAVARIRSAYPYYDMAPELITTILRRAPFAPDFMTFPVEMLRNQVNNYRNAVGDLRKTGDPRALLGTLVAHTAATALGATTIGASVAAVLRLIGGDDWREPDAEAKAAARALLPDWQRNSLLVWSEAPDGTLRYLDYDYIQPYDLLSKSTMTLSDARPAGQRGEALAAELWDQYTGIPMGLGLVTEILSNRDSRTGRDIVNEDLDSLAEKVGKWSSHAARAFSPPMAIYLARAAEVALADQDLEGPSGETETVGANVVKAVTPARVREFRPDRMFEARARELARIAQDLKAETGSTRRRAEAGYETFDDYIAAEDRAYDKLEGVISDRLAELIDAGSRFMTSSEIRAGLDAAGWAKQDIDDAMRRGWLTYRPRRFQERP